MYHWLLNLLLLLLFLLIYWDIKMASGSGESLKIWQKDYADQRCVLSYPCEKNHLYLVNFYSQVWKANSWIINVNFTPQALPQLHMGHSIYGRVCLHRIHCRRKDWALSRFGTFEVKKPQVVKEDTITSMYYSLPEYAQKQGRDPEKWRNSLSFLLDFFFLRK